MDSRVLEFIDRYYYRTDLEKVQALSRRAKGDAAKLVTSLGKIFAVVLSPIVTDYGKCVEIRAYVDEQAPDLGAGWQQVHDYIQRTGKPVWSLGVYLSWVGPYARVHMGSESINPAGELVVNQAPKDTELESLEERSRSAVRSLRYEVLTESDFGTPVAVDPKRVKEMDGMFNPPTTVGKCLFYPWWGGPDMRIDTMG